MGDESGFRQSLFSKPPRRLVLALSVAGVIAVGASAVYTLNFANQPPPESPPSRETPALDAVTALGRIEPQGEVIQVSPPPSMGGSKVVQLLVEEGDQVQADQVIAVLDNRDRLLADVERAQKEVKVAQANLAAVKAGAKAGEIAAQRATIERLQAQLRGEINTQQAITARLNAQLAGERQVQLATVDRLEAELRNAETEFDRYQQLAQNGAISQSDLDQRRLNLETTREQLNEARASRNLTVTTLNLQIQEATATLAQTRDTLNQQIQEARATLNSIAEVRPVDVQQAQAEVESALAALKQAQEDLELSTVKAPSSGQILKINAYPGETVDQKEGIAELGRTNQMIVVAEVHESDISQVQTGQWAIIKSDSGAFSDQLRGTVSQIGLQIGKKDVLDTDPAADVDVRVVEVEIRLNPEDSDRVAGLTNSQVVVSILL